jgi:hypothetical protein
MIKTCRLNYYGKDRDNPKDMKPLFESRMASVGVSMEDISINGPTYGTETHFGNWCIVPVLNNEAAQKIAALPDFELDYFQGILEPCDIEAFQVGDKVRINGINDFAMAYRYEGKVYAKTVDSITILKKGSRSKGWTFKPWDDVTIEKI